jgi:hypothetical protein
MHLLQERQIDIFLLWNEPATNLSHAYKSAYPTINIFENYSKCKEIKRKN